VTRECAAGRRALANLEANGDAFVVWQARALAGEFRPIAMAFPLGVSQRDDGSLAVDGTEARDFDPALVQTFLGAADDLQLMYLREVEKVCAHLEDVQCDDGSWGRAGDDETARIVATGMIAGHLGKTRFARASMLAAAGDYLAERFTPDLIQGGNWSVIAAYTHFFATVQHDESDAVLQWTGRELTRGFGAGRFDGVQTARVLLYADAPSLPGGRVDAALVLERVRAEQQPDGGWLRFYDPAPAARLAHTLDALAALSRFG
jgi:hypothetical protein